MKLLFLYGPPAVGKLTVAEELASLTGYRLFHNHLVVDMLFSVFEFGSPSFVELRESIWLSVFDHAARSGIEGLIFTFAPESTVRLQFIENLEQTIARAGGEIVFIELTCPLDEIRNRLNAPSRQKHGKLTSPELFDQLLAADAFNAAHMPKPMLTLDTSKHAPTESAHVIAQALQFI